MITVKNEGAIHVDGKEKHRNKKAIQNIKTEASDNDDHDGKHVILLASLSLLILNLRTYYIIVILFSIFRNRNHRCLYSISESKTAQTRSRQRS